MSLDELNRTHDDAEALRETVDAIRNEAPPAGAWEAARRTLLDKIEEIPEENRIMSALRNLGRPGVRWVTATGAAVLLFVGLVFFNPWSQGPEQAYAAVAQRLRLASTVGFSAQWWMARDEPPATLRMIFRQPGLQRIEMDYKGEKIISISNTGQNKAVTLLPGIKRGLELDYQSMPSAERERLELLKFITQSFRSLPRHVDGVLPAQTIDGLPATGFRVGDQTLWIELKSGRLMRVEKNFGGTRMVMSNFEIDPPGLDDSMFSLTLPAGYTPMSDKLVNVDVASPGEQDLVDYLRLASGMIKGHAFPASTNPMEILALQKEGKLIEGPRSPDEERRFIEQFSRASQRVMMFVMSMRQENDWHYAGKGAALGAAQTKIAWWKPQGKNTYRVIWGDLRITDEQAVQGEKDK